MTTVLAILTLLASANLFGLYAALFITHATVQGRWVAATIGAPAIFGCALAVAVIA